MVRRVWSHAVEITRAAWESLSHQRSDGPSTTPSALLSMNLGGRTEGPLALDLSLTEGEKQKNDPKVWMTNAYSEMKRQPQQHFTLLSPEKNLSPNNVVAEQQSEENLPQVSLAGQFISWCPENIPRINFLHDLHPQ